MDNNIVLDVTWLTLLISPVLPILVGLVTKKVAHSGVKAVTLLFLSAVTGVVNQAIADAGILSKDAVVAAVVAFVVAVATHYGLLKPTHITGSDGVVQNQTADVGIGR